MNTLDKLRRGEKGQVLYLTLILMMLLVLFTFILLNVLYLGITRVKAQNAADQIALSGAVLKARVLNKINDLNAVLFLGVTQSGRVSGLLPYASPADAATGVMISQWAKGKVNYWLSEYNQAEKQLVWIAQQNGFKLESGHSGIYPKGLIEPGDIFYEDTWFPCIGQLPVQVTVGVEPLYPWFCQVRLHFQTRKAMLGWQLLGGELPDIITTARSEVVDCSRRQTSWGHHWKARLKPIDKGVDERLRHWMGR